MSDDGLSYGEEQELIGLANEIPPDEEQGGVPAVIQKGDSSPVAAQEPPSSSNLPAVYRGASTGVSEHAAKVLESYRIVKEEDCLLKPHKDLSRAQVYLSHTKAREIYNEAFGPGGWSVVPKVEHPVYADGDKVVVLREFHFFAEGTWRDDVLGEGVYYKNNAEGSFADAYDSAKSEAIRKSTKIFGIGQNLYDKQWREAWMKRWAVQTDVWSGKDRKMVKVWVKRDNQLSGSGAGAPSTSGGNPTTKQPPAVETPSPQAEDPSPAAQPARPSTSPPESGNTRPYTRESNTVVTIKAYGDEQSNSYYKTDVINATAEDGTVYTFVGPDMISMAKDSKDFGRPVRLTDVKVNKGAGSKMYRNVRKAEWAD